MRPSEVRAAWAREAHPGHVHPGPGSAEVKKDGKVIMSSGQISASTGKATFDGCTVNKDWAKANQDFMVKFTVG
jgi:taurine transport system substrate-binding protein